MKDEDSAEEIALSTQSSEEDSTEARANAVLREARDAEVEATGGAPTFLGVGSPRKGFGIVSQETSDKAVAEVIGKAKTIQTWLANKKLFTDVAYNKVDVTVDIPVANPLLKVTSNLGFQYSGPASPHGVFESSVSGSFSIGLAFEVSKLVKVSVSLKGAISASSSYPSRDIEMTTLYSIGLRPLRVYVAHLILVRLDQIKAVTQKATSGVSELLAKLSIGAREISFARDFLQKDWAALVRDAGSSAANRNTPDQKRAFWRSWVGKFADKSVTPGWFTADGRAGLNRVFARLCRMKIGSTFSSAFKAIADIGGQGTVADRFGTQCAKLLGGSVIEAYDGMESFAKAMATSTAPASPAVLKGSLEKVMAEMNDLLQGLTNPNSLSARVSDLGTKVNKALSDLQAKCIEFIRTQQVTLKYTNTLTLAVGATVKAPIVGEYSVDGSFGGGIAGWVDPAKPASMDTSALFSASVGGSIKNTKGISFAASLSFDGYFSQACIKKLFNQDQKVYSANFGLTVTFPTDFGLGRAFTAISLARSPFVFDFAFELYKAAVNVYRAISGQTPSSQALSLLKTNATKMLRDVLATVTGLGISFFHAFLKHKFSVNLSFNAMFNSRFFQLITQNTNIKLLVVSDIGSAIPATMTMGMVKPGIVSGNGFQMSWGQLKAALDEMKKVNSPARK